MTGKGDVLTISLLTVGLGIGGYFYYNDVIKPKDTDFVVVSIPQGDGSLANSTKEFPIVPSESKTLSAKDELLQRKENLEKELSYLRSQRRDISIDTKKKDIKDEIKLIKQGITELEKNA